MNVWVHCSVQCIGPNCLSAEETSLTFPSFLSSGRPLNHSLHLEGGAAPLCTADCWIATIAFNLKTWLQMFILFESCYFLKFTYSASSFNLSFVDGFFYLPSPMLCRAVLGYRGVRHKTGLTGIFNVMHNGFFAEILHSSLSYRRSFHYSVNSPVTLRFHYIIYVSWYNSTV